MSMNIRPGYINPLQMREQKNNQHIQNSPIVKEKDDKTEAVDDLQLRKQALQDQILIMQSTSESSPTTAETKEVLEAQLEEVRSALRTAESQAGSMVSNNMRSFDTYEKEETGKASSGLYRIEQEEKGYNIIFDALSQEPEAQ